MRTPWQTGRGFCPPPGGFRGWWLIWGWFGIEVHPTWWRLGVSMSPWVFGVYLGPLVLRVGTSFIRWHVRQGTVNAGTGDTWQDVSLRITRRTGAEWTQS